jgi:hypothetical protein
LHLSCQTCYSVSWICIYSTTTTTTTTNSDTTQRAHDNEEKTSSTSNTTDVTDPTMTPASDENEDTTPSVETSTSTAGISYTRQKSGPIISRGMYRLLYFVFCIVLFIQPINSADTGTSTTSTVIQAAVGVAAAVSMSPAPVTSPIVDRAPKKRQFNEKGPEITADELLNRKYSGVPDDWNEKDKYHPTSNSGLCISLSEMSTLTCVQSKEAHFMKYIQNFLGICLMIDPLYFF